MEFCTPSLFDCGVDVLRTLWNALRSIKQSEGLIFFDLLEL